MKRNHIRFIIKILGNDGKWLSYPRMTRIKRVLRLVQVGKFKDAYIKATYGWGDNHINTPNKSDLIWFIKTCWSDSKLLSKWGVI